MKHMRRLWRWCNGGGVKRRIVVTPILAVLVISVSLLWHVDGRPHEWIRDACSYRGYMLTTAKAYRMIGGAVLIPNVDFYLSLPGLVAALYPLERRVGPWIVFGTISFAHIFASIVLGIAVRITHDHHALHIHDVGTSVLMTSAAAMLATITRNKAVWALVIGLYTFDLVLSHDLASAEHTIAIGCGIVSGILFRRRTPTKEHRSRPSLI
jgi:hypothetical protein